jgi:TetR/AcrR family transcriptional repressor of bet genes
MLNVLAEKPQYKAKVQRQPRTCSKPLLMPTLTSVRSTNCYAGLAGFWSASMHLPDLGRLQRINDQRFIQI